jgi:hypothetical protein
MGEICNPTYLVKDSLGKGMLKSTVIALVADQR